MHVAAMTSRRVGREATLLRGQSIIEYVLIIAIIGLVIVFAGPGVAGAIRNQFNLVGNTMDSGAAGENFYDATELPDPENGTAFAVYSEDDGSLMFYKRRGMPQVGEIFNDRRATEVYTGFEAMRYAVETTEDKSANDWTCKTLPWWKHREEIKTAKVNAEYHSSSCYVPSSLQLLKPEKVDMKSSGERMPIVAMLSKDASAKGYDTLLYVNEKLLESSRDSIGFIIRSFGDTDALRTSYPVLMDTVMGLNPNRDISLDDLFEDKTALAHELDELNRRRESFRNTLSHSPVDKSGR